MDGNNSSNLIFTGPLYDRLKFFALVVLPGLGACYFALAQIWGMPYAEEVVGSVTAIDTLLGLLLRASAKAYEKSGIGIMGDFILQQYPNGEVAGMRMVANQEPLIFPDQGKVEFKVQRETVSEPE